ncbi:MAG: hypothetical protein AABX16_04070 [Nanoarchaeota archaeon]
MGWSEWPAWVRGGVIIEIIVIILIVILFPFRFEFGIFDSTGYLPSSVFLLIPGSFVLILFGLNSDNLILSGLLSFIIYFIIGALIGFIVGKIKSRGKVQYKNV